MVGDTSVTMSMMRAMVVSRPGAPEVLTMREVPAPLQEVGQVLVAVEATGVNPVDCGNRVDPTWAALVPPYVVGYEFAGRVLAPSSGFEVNEPIWGLLPVQQTRWGALAEQVSVPLALVAARPPELTVLEAAVLPLAGCTALQVLQRQALTPGSWVMVHGAAGGVGHLLIQMARRRGLRVAAGCRPADRERLRANGVELLVDRAEVDQVAAVTASLGHELDAVVDLVGGLAETALPHLRVGGHFTSIVDLVGDLDLAIDRNLDVHGVLLRPDASHLMELGAEVALGLRPRVVEVFDLEQAAAAHRRVEAGGIGGKVVVKIAD